MQNRATRFLREYLTGSCGLSHDTLWAGEKSARWRGLVMEYETTTNRRTQILALMFTFAVVGGMFAYAM